MKYGKNSRTAVLENLVKLKNGKRNGCGHVHIRVKAVSLGGLLES
jgi:hypothetical protein